MSDLAPVYAWGDRSGPSLFSLVGDSAVRLDPCGVRAALGDGEARGRTCVDGVARVRAPYEEAIEGARDPRPLGGNLESALDAIGPGPVALALGGGVDAAVLAAMLGPRAVAYTLGAEPGYAEEAAARRLADRFGLELRVVRAGESERLRALPDAVRAGEAPLHGLHPVSRWILALAVRRDGHSTLVTGDGADQVFEGDLAEDYLPLVGSMARAAGVRTIAPYLDGRVAAHVARDPGKRVVRALAVELGVPSEIALAPKSARRAPVGDLGLPDPGALGARLARAAGWSPRGVDARVALATLSLFAGHLPGLQV